MLSFIRTSFFSLLPTELGYEQLAQRGCQTSCFSSLSLDLTSRLVSMEELSLSLNARVTCLEHNAPAAWWDRSCDIGLILGTFIHGLGNYESMLNDEALPFAHKVKAFVASDCMSADAHKRFVSAGSATKSVCDAALEASKLKAQKEVQKAVAAAAAASTEREKDAALLRDGVADESLINNMSEQKIDNLYEIEGGRDSHFITLPRIRNTLITTLHQIALPTASSPSTDDFKKGTEESKVRRRLSARLSLSMPDARILNFRLHLLLSSIEKEYYGEVSSVERGIDYSSPKIWPSSKEVAIFWKCKDTCPFIEETKYLAAEYSGVGIPGTQCGANHRTIDDRSDFSIAAATQDLYHVAHGPDAARYLRALGVPMSFGRFALLGLLYAEEKCLFHMLHNEKIKYFGEEEIPPGTLAASSEADRKSLPNEGDSTGATPNPQSKQAEISQSQISVNSADSILNQDANETLASKQSKDQIIPEAFRVNAELRAAVCNVVCYFGFPDAKTNGMIVDEALWMTISKGQKGHIDEGSRCLFQPTRFLSLLKENCNGIEIPEWEMIEDYVQKVFLPHCLKLCIYGNGSSTTDARGSKGKYETFDGSCQYMEPSEKLQSPLPDPCLPIREQSIEAVGMACAILRRVRLTRSLTNVASGAIKHDDLQKMTKSPLLRQSMDGLPVWWCPWIHDIALVFHASTRGLFSIVQDRKNGKIVDGTAFSKESIARHIQSTFFGDATTIPDCVTASATADDLATWASVVAEEFPSMNVIERRLSFLCAIATEKFQGDQRFENLPMYDHGAWPRN
jgi:hypothetical protein